MNLIRKVSVTLAVSAVTVVAAAVPGAGGTALAAATPSPVGTGRLVQLGSLGGGESWAERMNERGDMVGGSADATGTWQAAVWWHGRRSPTALGVDRASPSAISDRGRIAGSFWDGGLFLWHRGTVTRLRPSAGTTLEVTGVNDRGQVVGTAYREDGTSRAFLWQRGRLTILPVPGARNSSAVGINDRGQIIGVVRPETPTEQAVLWQRGRMIALGTLGGAASTPVAINDRGQVIGGSTVAGSSADHPFLWDRGRMTDLLAGTGAITAAAYALSDTGIVTGSVSRRIGEPRPVLWRAGRMVDIGLPGHVGFGKAVNDRGEVAGSTWADPQGTAVPFRWRNGHTTLFPEPKGDVAVRVVGIDRHGTVGVAQETSRFGLILLRSA